MGAQLARTVNWLAQKEVRRSQERGQAHLPDPELIRVAL